MKRFVAVLLVVLLLCSTAMAEGIAAVNDYVAKNGYTAQTEKNKSGIQVCDYYEPAKGAHSIVWSDSKNVYTITASRKKDALQALYIELVGMYSWDSCTYAVDETVQFAFNAPEANAAKTYKTLTNYARAVQKYITPETAQAAASTGKSGQQDYIVNTSSKKFHLPDCSYVDQMKKENREKVRTTRDKLIADGYEPCGHCKP